jgi:hypothetical protein
MQQKQRAEPTFVIFSTLAISHLAAQLYIGMTRRNSIRLQIAGFHMSTASAVLFSCFTWLTKTRKY